MNNSMQQIEGSDIRTSTQDYAPVQVPVEQVKVVCPSWCTIMRAEHIADLPDREGTVIHRGIVGRVETFILDHAGEPATVKVELCAETLVDGRAWAGVAPDIDVLGGEGALDATQARELASVLLRAADLSEAAPR